VNKTSQLTFMATAEERASIGGKIDSILDIVFDEHSLRIATDEFSRGRLQLLGQQ
jgi:hypothetical protein